MKKLIAISTLCMLTCSSMFADYYQSKETVVNSVTRRSADNLPLRPGAFSFQIKGGIAPAFFTHRGPVWLTIPSSTPSVSTSTFTAQFDDQFHLPWQIGMEVGVNVGRHSEFFLEGFYQEANSKTYNFIGGNGAAISEVFTNYKNPSFYLGSRYYIYRFDCGFAPFLGFKGGAAWQARVDYQLTSNGTFVGTNEYYEPQWAPSAGLQAGFDWALAKHVSFVFTGEAVATGGMKNNRNVVLDPTLSGGITNVSIGETGKVISFPITIGFKFTF